MLTSIRDESARKAAQETPVPYVPSDVDELDGCPPFPFPSVGSLARRAGSKQGSTGASARRRSIGEDDTAMTCDEFMRSSSGIYPASPGAWLCRHGGRRLPGGRVGIQAG